MTTPARRIIVATSAFQSWLSSAAGRTTLLKALGPSLLAHRIVHGLQLCLTIDELHVWATELQRGRRTLPYPWSAAPQPVVQEILALPLNSVHINLPQGLLSDTEQVLVGAMNAISAATGITLFSASTEELSTEDIARLIASTPKALQLAVQTPLAPSTAPSVRAMVKLLNATPRLRAAFDLRGYLEREGRITAKELQATFAQTKSPTLHFIAIPGASAVNEKGEQIAEALLVTSSRTDLAACASIPSDGIFVVRGVIPVNQLANMRREIALIQSGFNLSALTANERTPAIALAS